MPHRHATQALFGISLVLNLAYGAEFVSAQNAPVAVGATSRPAIRDALFAAGQTDSDMTQIFAMVTDRAGNVYAWDSEDMTVRQFDSRGRPRKQMGGRGQGPGEISQLGSLALIADTLWATESFSFRVTAFPLKSGAPKTTVVRPTTGTGSDLVTRMSDGFWVRVRTTQLGVSGSSTVSADLAGKLKAPISPFRAAPRPLQFNVVQEGVRGGPGVGRQVNPQPFESRVLLEAFPDGSGFIQAAPGNAQNGSADTFELSSIGTDGLTRWSRHVRYVRTPLTDADVEKAIAAYVSPTVVKGMKLVGDRKMIRDSLVRPTHWPPFTSVVLGIDGAIWVQSGTPRPDGSKVYWRFSARGDFEVAVSVPREVRVQAVTRDFLWGAKVNADGAAMIERFGVAPPH
ncbi:MAG: hypothetical protein ACO1Q7_10165 [Gemmatimonas sp.]